MEYRIIRSARKTIAIEIRPDLSVLVRAPQRASQAQIRRFVQEKEAWILDHLEKMKVRMQKEQEAPPPELLSMEQIKALADAALKDIPQRVRRYLPAVGVTCGRVTIRNQRSRWGSCSAKGNLNFNCLLMLAPEYVRDYVVVHELCHRLEMNHSDRFWAEVARVMPDYREAKDWLKKNGTALMRRMTG